MERFLQRCVLSFLVAVLILFSFPISTIAYGEDFLTDGDWQYTLSGNRATIMGYLGSEADVTVPATVGGVPVRTFFCDLQENKTITVLRFEEGIETILDYACRNCESLSEVYLPNSLKSIGGEAFSRDPNLLVVSVPASIQEVEMRFLSDTAYSQEPSNWKNGMLFWNPVILEIHQKEVGSSAVI
ncbi:MAG: leucine-rich repeat protein, partial [Clostridia bacterium]|nr:leucine-rich repeat protein [Clostridia bacterium]